MRNFYFLKSEMNVNGAITSKNKLLKFNKVGN